MARSAGQSLEGDNWSKTASKSRVPWNHICSDSPTGFFSHPRFQALLDYQEDMER